MKITKTAPGAFRLDCECQADQDLVDTIDIQGHIAVLGFERESQGEGRGYANVGVRLLIDRTSEQALRDQAARQCLSAAGQLLGLTLREAAQHGHVGGLTVDPQSQEQLAAQLVQLQAMLDRGRDVVHQLEVVLQEMSSAHGVSLHEEKTIVSTAGEAS